jgi:hypothetical protein
LVYQKQENKGGERKKEEIIIIIMCRVAAKNLVTGKGLAFLSSTVQRIRMS